MKDKKETSLPINEKIRAEKMQLITSQGENVGVVPRFQALRMAQEAELDLVVIAEGKDGIPIAKIMDFGKALYKKKKKTTEAKKHQKVIQVKEVKMSPKIGEHDYQTKMKQAIQFLQDGKRVKMTLVFGKGRESIGREERGRELFNKINQSFEEHQILSNLVQEADAMAGQFWSRIYYLKNSK